MDCAQYRNVLEKQFSEKVFLYGNDIPKLGVILENSYTPFTVYIEHGNLFFSYFRSHF